MPGMLQHREVCFAVPLRCVYVRYSPCHVGALHAAAPRLAEYCIWLGQYAVLCCAVLCCVLVKTV
jgi:hypothetical protein